LKDGNETSLMESFSSSSYSDYFVAYLRYVFRRLKKVINRFSWEFRLFTSAYLQMNSDFFENFIEDGKTVKQFCMTVCPIFFSIKFSFIFFCLIKEVEPMARESDNIHIIALAKASGVPLRVIYMDRNEQTSLTTHDFSATDDENSNTFKPMITMLYRPGHYDLLYKH